MQHYMTVVAAWQMYMINMRTKQTNTFFKIWDKDEIKL